MSFNDLNLFLIVCANSDVDGSNMNRTKLSSHQVQRSAFAILY